MISLGLDKLPLSGGGWAVRWGWDWGLNSGSTLTLEQYFQSTFALVVWR
jgi:hypothetical protein